MSDPFRETHDLGARIRFREDENPVCEEPLVKGPEDVAKLRHFDPLDSTRMLDRIRAVEAYRREAGDHYAILGWVEGPLAEAADLRGVSEILMDMYTEPGLVRDLMAFCRDGAIRCARAQLAAGADLIGIGDAVASLVPPDFFAEQLLPLERDLVEAIHGVWGAVSGGRPGAERVWMEAPPGTTPSAVCRRRRAVLSPSRRSRPGVRVGLQGRGRRGKSGHHRAGCRPTAGRGDPQDSATENRPPNAADVEPSPERAPGAGVARVKRCGKSAPRDG